MCRWNTNYLENHDQARMISRIASDTPQFRTKSAQLIAIFHCTLTGTIFLFQGEEIGLANVPRTWPAEEYKDVNSMNYLKIEKEFCERTGKVWDEAKAVQGLRLIARDNGRTPMQVGCLDRLGRSEGRQGFPVVAKEVEPDEAVRPIVVEQLPGPAPSHWAVLKVPRTQPGSMSHSLTNTYVRRADPQWDASQHSGFSKSTPWMRVHDDYKDGWNVAAQVEDPTSTWSFWRKMLALRKEYPALIYGEWRVAVWFGPVSVSRPALPP